MEEERIRKALEFCVNNPDLDLRTFEQSSEYDVLKMGLQLSEHLGSVYMGFPIVIDGDLESINISGKNEITLIILYAQTGSEKRYARVIYNSDSYVDFIRKELLPMTHVRITAQYTKDLGKYKGGDIRLYNEPLIYRHYCCPDCGHDYGTGKECEGQYCEICADEVSGKLKYVTDFYRINT